MKPALRCNGQIACVAGAGRRALPKYGKRRFGRAYCVTTTCRRCAGRHWGDLLAAQGMHDSGVLEYLISAWDHILTDSNADLVIADFAPASMLSANGRIPVVVVGTGFTVPPSEGAAFPLLRGEQPMIAQEALLQVVNRALQRTGRTALSTLAQMASADVACPATFAALDPYRGHRKGALYPPFVSGEIAQAGEGTTVFVYAAMGDPRTLTLMRALPLVAKAGLPVMAYLPGLAAADARMLEGAGVRVLSKPAQQSNIAKDARLLVTTGGLGMASFALAAGLPMALLPLDLEKQLTARAVAAFGCGVILPNGSDADAMAKSTINAAQDTGLTAQAHRQAPQLMAQIGHPAIAIAQQCIALL